MPNSLLTGARVPDPAYAADIAKIVQDAVADLEGHAIPRFADTAERDTTYTAWVAAGGVLEDGMFCHTAASGGILWKRTAGAWATTGAITGTLTPATGWAAEPNYYTPGYHLSSDLEVTLRGRLLRTGAAVTLTSAPAILTLPAAIRPTSAIAPDTYVGIGGPPAQRYPAVLPCGSPFTTLTVADMATSAGTFNTGSGYVSLDGVSWYL